MEALKNETVIFNFPIKNGNYFAGEEQIPSSTHE
jgi:hypothetical protein